MAFFLESASQRLYWDRSGCYRRVFPAGGRRRKMKASFGVGPKENSYYEDELVGALELARRPR